MPSYIWPLGENPGQEVGSVGTCSVEQGVAGCAEVCCAGARICWAKLLGPYLLGHGSFKQTNAQSGSYTTFSSCVVL